SDVASTVAANINTAVGYTLATVVSGELKLQDPSGSVITIGGSTGVAAGVGFSTTTSTASAGGVETGDQLVALTNATTGMTGKIKASNNAGQLQTTTFSISQLTVTGIGSSGVTGIATGTSTTGGNTVRNNLVTQFNDLRDQLDKTAADSSFNG